MKKTVKFLVVTLMCVCIFIVSGCSLFDNSDNNSSDNNSSSNNNNNSESNNGGNNSGNTGIRPEDINYEYVFKSDMYFEEDPQKSSYNIYGNTGGAFFPLDKFESEYFYKVASSNPEVEFRLTAYAEIYGANAEFGVGVSKQTNESGISKKKSYDCSKEYTSVNVSMKTKGRALAADDMKILVSYFCTDFGCLIYCKNLYFKIEIISQS